MLDNCYCMLDNCYCMLDNCYSTLPMHISGCQRKTFAVTLSEYIRVGKSYLAVPSSSAQNLIITTANLLHFSAWHKMILTGVQHGSLLHLSARHGITLPCGQLPDPLG